ncbi:hypothetical protein [Mesorhizobium sp. M0140]
MVDKDRIRTLIRNVIVEEIRNLKGGHAAASALSAVTIASDGD